MYKPTDTYPIDGKDDPERGIMLLPAQQFVDEDPHSLHDSAVQPDGESQEEPHDGEGQHKTAQGEVPGQDEPQVDGHHHCTAGSHCQVACKAGCPARADEII